MPSNSITVTNVDTNILNDEQFTYAQLLLVKGYAQRIVDELSPKAKKLTLTIVDLTLSCSDVIPVWGNVFINGKFVRSDEVLAVLSQLLEEVQDYLFLVNDVEEDEELNVDIVIHMTVNHEEDTPYLSEISIEVEYLNQDEDEDEDEDKDEDWDEDEDEDQDEDEDEDEE